MTKTTSQREAELRLEFLEDTRLKEAIKLFNYDNASTDDINELNFTCNAIEYAETMCLNCIGTIGEYRKPTYLTQREELLESLHAIAIATDETHQQSKGNNQ